MHAHETESLQAARCLIVEHDTVDGAVAVDGATIVEVCERLKQEKEFAHARRLLEQMRARHVADPSLRRRLRFLHAVCTFKDPELTSEQSLDDALKILKSDGDDDLRTNRDQKALSLAGAIHRRKWELDGRKEHLEISLQYFSRAHALGIESDNGRSAVNTAFVLDLLADIEETLARDAGGWAPGATERRARANSIRAAVVAVITPQFLAAIPPPAAQRWSMLVTLGEACLGLGRYADARRWLQQARALTGVSDWDVETTTRQLVSLSRIRDGIGPRGEGFATSEAISVIRDFLGEHAAGALTAFVGRVGLALSGGGFRASLFHLGVLAKLAEFDVLRHVEVLSCVSGGSIVGAHYYLELRRLLERTGDAVISRQDYIDVVERVKTNFLKGVRTDIRTNVFRHPIAVAKLLFKPGYSRTMRIGELFERELYATVADGAGQRPRFLADLTVRPAGEPAGFNPKRDNWRRAAKVPVLLLNATALNTGHNWQFAATWMGEPVAAIEEKIDGNYRLRRMYHWEIGAAQKKVRLGTAVAASACVPGLFRPITMKGLYSGKTVRLVDGGVHDNQGIFGLLEQDCTVTLISDASGQMEAQDHPSFLSLRVPMRSNSILMAAVRSTQYRGLEARRRASRLHDMMYVHLKKDLSVEPVIWAQAAAGSAAPRRPLQEVTSYGMPCSIQRRLAAIRTDLDAFSEIEAQALMLSGYLMTEHELPTAVPSLPLTREESRVTWDFLTLAPLLHPETRTAKRFAEILEELDVGRYRFFRRARRSRLLRMTRRLLRWRSSPRREWTLRIPRPTAPALQEIGRA